jgi:hypothetical protein
MMDLETCRYIDFPEVGVIDLEVPQPLEKEYKVAAERRSNEPTIMDMITSVSKALQEYEHAGGFTSATGTGVEDAALAALAACVKPTEDASALPHVDESREVPSPELVETAETPAPMPEPSVAEPVVGEEGASPPDPIAAEAEGFEARVLDDPDAIAQESAVPEMVARATTSEIQVVEETGASLPQGAVGGKARTLELACTSWAATSGLDSDSEDNEEATARHTLECWMTWARRAFDELILPATSVSLLVKDSFLIL